MYIERRDKEDNNYSHLQEQSLRMLQKLSGKRWTDFNEHDPGVTIMDVLNYNLLELTYQTEFDFERYLIAASMDELEFSRVGLLSADEIFASCIVTPNDYQDLIIKEVIGVKNCVVEIIQGNIYQILIDTEEGVKLETVVNEVTVLYHCHRNLGENLGGILVANLPQRGKEKQLASVVYNQETKTTSAQNAFTQLHTSIQYDFPDTYGINGQGLPAYASEHRKAQALQLKGYLLIFDYLLSATKQQLGGLYQMLSLSEQIPTTFSHRIQATDLDKLLDLDKLEQTELLDKEEIHKRKSTYLDMLDALYGEDSSLVGQNTSLPIKEINRRRAKLIQQFPALNTNRFRSFNILDNKDVPAIKQIIAHIVGIDIHEEIPTTIFFAHHHLQLIDDDVFFQKYKRNLNIDVIENTDPDFLKLVPSVATIYSENRYNELYVCINLLWHNVLYQSFLSYGSDINNYRIIDRWDKGLLLIFKIPEQKGWLLLGQFYEKEMLIETANLFCQFIKYLNIKSQNFYLIEHILLNTSNDESLASNKLSIVYPQWSDSFNEKEYQERIKERLPIHIEVNFVGLSMCKLIQFEQHYYSWRKALTTDKKEQIKEYAEFIKQLIIKY